MLAATKGAATKGAKHFALAPPPGHGTSLLLGGGELGTVYGRLVQAGVAGRLGYRLSGSYFEQDPYDGPTGLIPGTTTPYPPFENDGTEQIKGSHPPGLRQPPNPGHEAGGVDSTRGGGMVLAGHHSSRPPLRSSGERVPHWGIGGRGSPVPEPVVSSP